MKRLFFALLSLVCLATATILSFGCDVRVNDPNAPDRGSPTAPTNPLQPPVISSFTADTLVAKVGTITYLRWDVIGKDTVCRIDPAIGNVPTTGNIPIFVQATATYVLVCSNSAGVVNRQFTLVATP